MGEGLLPSSAQLIGRKLVSVEKKDFTWFFVFGDDMTVDTEGLWRLITSQGIHVTSDDHGHRFGLPQPVDAAERVQSTLDGRLITTVDVEPLTGDLRIGFDDATQIQFLQTSCGYESWRLLVGGDETICTGGGSLMHFSNSERPPSGESR